MKRNTLTEAEAAKALRRGPTPRPPHSNQLQGLGDVVAGATSAAGVTPCGGCLRRKAALNRATPAWVKRLLHRLAGWLATLAR